MRKIFDGKIYELRRNDEFNPHQWQTHNATYWHLIGRA